MTEITWTEQVGVPLLSIILWLPLLVLAGVAAARGERAERVIALAGAAVELSLSLWLLTHFVRGTASLQFVEHLSGGGGWLSYHLGVDGLSVLFLPLTSLLALLLIAYVVMQAPSARRRASLLLICAYQTILVGLFVSLDALQFWLFAFAELVLAVLLVAVLGTGSNRIRTAVYLLQFLGVSVMLLLVALVMLAWQFAESQGGAWTFDMVRWLASPTAQGHQGMLLGVILLALAIRLPAFPFHVWLPAIARQGPVAIAVVLLGGMQVAVYALLRIVLPLLPIAVHTYAWALTWVALAGILYGAVLAFMQLNLRSMLAFAVVSQNGAMLVALFSLTRSGIEGGLLLALNYGLALAGLLLIVGLIYRRAGTALLPRLAGLFDRAPLIGLVFLAAALGRIAMPGTPGFEAAHLALEGTLEARGWGVTMLAGLSNVLAAGYLLWAYQRIFLARPVREGPQCMDLSSGERVVAGALCAVMFGVGLYARPWLEVVSASTQELAAHVADFALHAEALAAADVGAELVEPAHGL